MFITCRCLCGPMPMTRILFDGWKWCGEHKAFALESTDARGGQVGVWMYPRAYAVRGTVKIIRSSTKCWLLWVVWCLRLALTVTARNCMDGSCRLMSRQWHRERRAVCLGPS